MQKDKLHNLRHSAAHLLAAAVMELYPRVKRTIGPAIENGFYFDFDFGKSKVAEKDLEKIEKKMHKLAPTWAEFSRHELSVEKSKAEYPENEYKHELIDEIAKTGKLLTFYKSGNYWDLCEGGHVKNGAKELKHFKLLNIAGAYWRGDEKNKMLTRIYGTIWPTKEELDKHLWQLEQAELRNHKKVGQELELFYLHESAPGMPYWLPNGTILYNALVDFWRDEHKKAGYKEVVSPLVNKKELFITSGHFNHFWQDMFHFETEEGEEYALKAMNCPNAMILFKHKSRSYRELPLRLSDIDTLHRNELSGTLNGLLRVREFKQDDAHIYVAEDQIEEEFKNIFKLVERFYSVFGMDYYFRFSTRPDNFMGDIETWDKAEKNLKKILDDSGKKYILGKKEGAFYGPKIDILMNDILGREWQTGTIQLDFQMPKRFGLVYIGEDGKKHTPVVIHKVIYGSLERFIGILIEHYGGAFPIWLSPVQAIVLPITERNTQYANSLRVQLENEGIRAESNTRQETLKAKIRDAQVQKIPYILVVGDREESTQSVAVRLRNGQDLGALKIKDSLGVIKKAIAEKQNIE